MANRNQIARKVARLLRAGRDLGEKSHVQVEGHYVIISDMVYTFELRIIAENGGFLSSVSTRLRYVFIF